MPWVTSNRRDELPDNWPALRQAVKRRADGRCEYRFPNGGRCREPGTDCDHVGDREDHSPGNLQWLCSRHHQMKTQSQSADARRIIAAKGRHPVERQPGLL